MLFLLSLKHGDEFELLILAGASGVLAVISLILAIASRGGDDYDDEDDYDDPLKKNTIIKIAFVNLFGF